MYDKRPLSLLTEVVFCFARDQKKAAWQDKGDAPANCGTVCADALSILSSADPSRLTNGTAMRKETMDTMIASSRLAAGIALAIAVTHCTSVPTQQNPASDRVIATVVGDAVLRTRETNQQGRVSVEAPPDKVLAALYAAYADLGIEVKLWDPPHGQVGNRVFSRMYRMGGAPLSQYLGCGATMTGDAADSYRVTMSLVSQVAPASGGSTVMTSLSAYAEDLGSSKGTISCSTRGTLEDRLHQLTMRHLAD
jgi:hypothetical protein